MYYLPSCSFLSRRLVVFYLLSFFLHFNLFVAILLSSTCNFVYHPLRYPFTLPPILSIGASPLDIYL